MNGLPMPPENDYARSISAFYRYVWDTTGVPEVQEFPDVVVVTPQVGRLVVYGRAVESIYEEDRRADLELRRRGRFMGEWFSTACPEGELGSRAFTDCEPISAEEFSNAYQRGWKP